MPAIVALLRDDVLALRETPAAVRSYVDAFEAIDQDPAPC